MALVRWDCWVPLGPGRGRRDDGGRGMGAAWDVFSRLGECVQFWGRCVQFLGECVQFRGQCVQFFGPMCSLLRGMCPLWRGMCPVLGGAPWLGMGRGRKARFLLRQAQDRPQGAQGRFFGNAAMTGEVASGWWVVGSGW